MGRMLRRWKGRTVATPSCPHMVCRGAVRLPRPPFLVLGTQHLCWPAGLACARQGSLSPWIQSCSAQACWHGAPCPWGPRERASCPRAATPVRGVRWPGGWRKDRRICFKGLQSCPWVMADSPMLGCVFQTRLQSHLRLLSAGRSLRPPVEPQVWRAAGGAGKLACRDPSRIGGSARTKSWESPGTLIQPTSLAKSSQSREDC